MSRSTIAQLHDHLVERDYQILNSLESYRLLTTRQIQRLHFDPHHPTPVAKARACNRHLKRLQQLDVVRPLRRRIGGARAGSASYVWYLGPAGDRLLAHQKPGTQTGRRNYREPSRHFVDHTLAVAELAVRAIEAGRAPEFDVLSVEAEPSSWQASLSPHGTTTWLKPDLRLVTATGEFEDHWFIEADLATEHLPVIVRQCQAYQTFRTTGRYQTEHGLFPAVLWVTPTTARADALRTAIARHDKASTDETALFQVCTTEQYLAVITGASSTGTTPRADTNNKSTGGQEGGPSS